MYIDVSGIVPGGSLSYRVTNSVDGLLKSGADHIAPDQYGNFTIGFGTLLNTGGPGSPTVFNGQMDITQNTPNGQGTAQYTLAIPCVQVAV